MPQNSETFSIRAFVGLSEKELLTIRANLIDQINQDIAGTTIQSVQTSGLSTTFYQSSGSPSQMLRAVNYALQKLKPEVYGNEETKVKRFWSY